MKIGIDIRELQLGIMTGIGRYLTNFLHWAIPANPDCSFYLYGNKKTHFNCQAENVVIRIIPEGCTLWWDQVTLPRQMKGDRLDVFLSPYIKGPLFTPIPLVTTMHDLMFLVLPEYKRNILWELCYKRFAKLVSMRAKVILTDSAFSKADIMRLLKIPGEKIRVIPLSVAEKYFEQPHSDSLVRIRQKFGISKRYILYVGNFKPHKNVSRLIKAYSQLNPDLTDDYQLVLCGGKDVHVKQIHNLIAALKIEKKVVFTDMVIGDDLPALYYNAELFVFPSLYEGFGLPVVEAMASGTAVITSKVTSIPEVVGDSALLVNPEDEAAITAAISKLLTDASLREEYIKKGTERAEQFRAAKTGAMVFEQLNQVLKT